MRQASVSIGGACRNFVSRSYVGGLERSLQDGDGVFLGGDVVETLGATGIGELKNARLGKWTVGRG